MSEEIMQSRPDEDRELPVFRGDEYEDHVTTWLEVDRSLQGHFWMLGAIAASLDKKYGADVFGKFGSDVGSSKRRIREYAATYRAWENGERSPFLTFHHHTIAGRSENPERAIEVAEDEQLSTRELDEFVRTGELPERSKPTEEEELVGDLDIVRIVRTQKMEYVVEYGDGARHTVSREALLEDGFRKCSACSGHGVEKRHHRSWEK